MGANVIRFPPIGYYAYYQTSYFPMHPDLNGRDLLQEMIDAVKEDKRRKASVGGADER